MIDNVIQAFGHSLGIDGLSLGPNDVVSLDFAQRGMLFIEPGKDVDADEVLVYLARHMPPYETAYLAQALRLTHFQQGHPIVVQAGLRGDDTLVFIARLPAHEFTLPALESTLELLSELHERVTH